MIKLKQQQINALVKRAASFYKNDADLHKVVSQGVYYEVAPGRSGILIYNAKKENVIFLPKLFIRDL